MEADSEPVRCWSNREPTDEFSQDGGAFESVGSMISQEESMPNRLDEVDNFLSDQVTFNVDSRAVLKAFRLIGGFGGVHIEELRHAISLVRAEQVRKPLLKLLDGIFSVHDHDGNGVIDIVEFEKMVGSSTLLQAAIYDVLQTQDDEAKYGRIRDIPILEEYMEFISLVLVLLYVIAAAIAVDNSPHWKGWRVLDLVFACLFSIDYVFKFSAFSVSSRRHDGASFSGIFSGTLTGSGAPVLGGRSEAIIRDPTSTLNTQYTRKLNTSSRGREYATRWFWKTCYFFSIPMNLLDFVATVFGWMDVCDQFIHADMLSDSYFWSLQQLRWLRLFHLVRMIHFMTYFRQLGILLIGIYSGLQQAFWGLLTIAIVVFLWASFIRQKLVFDADKFDDGALKDIFPSISRSVHVVFRCMVLRSDGSCTHNQHGPMVALLSAQLGWFFDVAWLSSEVFIFFVIANVITATFVIQAHENAKHIAEGASLTSWSEDEVRLGSLDKLLRTLIYPLREKEQNNPKDRYAAQVANMIRTDHPEAAAKIPNLEREVVNFARGIQESKSLLQNAMNLYEAKELTNCKRLQNTPSATTYMVNGEEVLLVEKKDAAVSNSLQIPAAPMSAGEVLLMQEQTSLKDLLEEAAEVQQHVKSLLYPNSEWAATQGSGFSGDIWKASNRLCDEAMDPGPKGRKRIEQKVNMKYGGRFQRNRDYCRLGLVYDSVKHLMQALPKFIAFRLATDTVQVASIENRFVHPHPLGWRDITILLKVNVPSTGRKHIMELQLMLRGLTDCRKENHAFYEEIRGVLPDDVLMTILDRLTTDTTLDLGLTKTEWFQCLRNTEVKKLLDGLGVPTNSRKRLFDLVDIDDSGTVTSSELQEILRLYRTPAQALELAGCHLRVREVQRHAQTKLRPEIHKLYKHMITNLSSVEQLLIRLTNQTRRASDMPNHRSILRSSIMGARHSMDDGVNLRAFALDGGQEGSMRRQSIIQGHRGNSSASDVRLNLSARESDARFSGQFHMKESVFTWMQEFQSAQDHSFKHLLQMLTTDVVRGDGEDGRTKKPMVKLPSKAHPSTPQPDCVRV